MKRLAIASVALLASAARGQAASEEAGPSTPPPRAIMLAPKVGLLVPTSKLGSALWGGAEIGWATPLLDRRLAVALEIGWARPRAEGTVADPQLGAADGSWRLGASQFGILLSAIYRFEGAVSPAVTPYAGGGPALYLHRAAITAFAENTLETEAKLGMQLLCGVEYRAGPGAALLEASWRLARVDFTSTGSVQASGFLFSAGYRFRL